MYSFKGFAQHASLVSNKTDAVNAIGEISTLALTYAKDVGIYSSPTIDNITAYSFLSATDGVAEEAPAAIKEHILTVLSWVYNYSFQQSSEIDTVVFLNKILEQFSSVASSFECGEVVKDDTYYIPEWVSWSFTALSGSFIKIWFSDNSFRAQYDNYEIVVVPPFESVDTFLKGASKVKTAIAGIDMPAFMTRVQSAKDGCPDTLTRFISYDYANPSDSTDTTPVTWAVIIYGAAGNNVDSINEAISTYVLANSASGRDIWVVIFPDIFRRTEFILVPNWGSYAIENRTVEAGIYNSVIKPVDAIALLTKCAPAYSALQISTYMEVVPHPYKCLSMAVVGSADNKNGLYSFSQVFADYLPLSTSSTDFNRMSSATRTFCEALAKMLIIAEELTQYSTIGNTDFTRLKRDGILYLVFTYNSIHYMVAAKSNF